MLFPSALLGLKTNILFYSIYSVTHIYNNIQSPILGVMILIFILIISILTLMKNTTFNNYTKNIFNKFFNKTFNNKNIKTFLIVNLLYDLSLSTLISTLKGKPTLQTLLFLILEGIYFTFILLKRPFISKLTQNAILLQRGICLIQDFSC